MSKNNFTKNDIIKNLSKKTGFSILLSNKLIDDFLNVSIESIKINQLNLRNIGTIKLIYKKERLGRNPKTKEEFIISARKSISFTPSKKILVVLNKN